MDFNPTNPTVSAPENLKYSIDTDNGPLTLSADYLHGAVYPLQQLANHIHNLNKKWWVDMKTGEPLNRNVGELLMLTTSELAEAMEGDRKSLQDDHIPQFKMFDLEIMDAFIRLFDIAAGKGIDFKLLFIKLAYNAIRADHKLENRLAPGGKAY